MRVLVIGAGGMLGHKVYQTLSDQFETWGTVRSSPALLKRFGIFEEDRLIGGIDATDHDALVDVLDLVRPDVVVNAVGIVKQRAEATDPLKSISINSLAPHRLAALSHLAGARLIHVSTDCVFAGTKGSYTEDDFPDANDLYGRTKFLGEVGGPNALTLRTSIIGRELTTQNGLVEWFLSNKNGVVDGYRRSIFSGLPTLVLAETMSTVITKHQDLAGTFHVSADPITKLDLLELIRDAYGVAIDIRATDGEEVDRSLDSNRFRAATGITFPTWQALVEKMAGDPTPYENWRNSN